MVCEPITQTIISDFETDKDGWTAANACSGEPNHNTNAARARVGTGYLSASDGDGGATYYIAPPKFLGDKSGYVGGSFSYWMAWTLTGADGAPFSSLTWPDVEIRGVSTSKVLVFSSGEDDWPEEEWLLRTLTFEEGPGLRVYDSGSAAGIGGAVEATLADIEEVLANVAGIRIRGEYRSGGDGPDYTRLDHVIMEPGS